MEPLTSQTTLPHSEIETLPPARGGGGQRQLLIASFVIALVVAAVAWWSFDQWSSRTVASAETSRTPLWLLEASSTNNAQAFVRIQDTSYWSNRTNELLTSSSHVAAQSAAVSLKSQVSKASLTVAPHSVVHVDRANAAVLGGFALATGPMRVELSSGDRFIRDQESVLIHSGSGPQGMTTEIVSEITPRVGSIHDLQTSGRIDFSWPKALASTNATLEFARDASFQSILFSHPASGAPNAGVDFSDRSPGAWFVRLREGEKLLAYTAINVVESEMPDQLRRLGRRWFSWRSRGLAALYRVELSSNETFQKIDQSFQVRNRELDLTLVNPGSYFARVIAISVLGVEHASRPIVLQVQDKAAILSAGLELNDPELKLYARGWKILLTHGEVSRIREGYVILRESELRGVKVASELIQDPITRAATLNQLVFEISRDEAFSNPERVRPDSSGELLPPALPLGVLFARVRRVETDGALGAFGPTSRLTTWLPAPIPKAPKTTIVQDVRGVELKWELATNVAGYELRVSPTRDFAPASTYVIRTRSPFRRIASPTLREFYWTVMAINEFGQPISVLSEVQEVKDLKQELKPKSPIAKSKSSDRVPAMATPTSPLLQFPLEDAVVVGGATATKYGKLTWKFAGTPNSGFEIQIATDGDFVNVIEKAKTKKSEFTLQGDLPEGALFWRVRSVRAGSKGDEWSRSRKFELIYE
ncbi:hypothetical protein BH10BDE1_BH10BDE1_02430 [soil metagenome]